jgi:DNA-binding transcriptional ArsR family regulator
MQPIGYEASGGLDATFAALADPTRRAILARLASGEATVSELAEPFAMTQPAISKHLKVLERAGLISRGRDAQRRPSRLEAAPLAEANRFLEAYREFWEASIPAVGCTARRNEKGGEETCTQEALALSRLPLPVIARS